MKMRPFSLESVLTLRRHRTVEAAAGLAEASRVRLGCEHALQEARRRVLELEQECERLMQHEVRASQILHFRQGIELGRAEVAECEAALAESVQAEQHHRETLSIRKTEEEAVARLKEKHREALRKEGLRLDERASEDFVLAKRSHLQSSI